MKPVHPREDLLVWMDLEFTGLDPKTCTILEIASLITGADLEVVAEGPVLAIHHPQEVLTAMDAWNREHHGKSGLLDRCRHSTVSLLGAQDDTLAFFRQYVGPGASPLCGNSVHQDRRFLYRYMPAICEHLHYRNLDVSTVKELALRWYPRLPKFEKAQRHRALDDIRESLEELKYYRREIFREPSTIPANP